MTNSYEIIKVIISAGPVVQGVLLILILMSVLCWTIIILKARIFSKIKKKNLAFDSYFSRIKDLSQTATRAKRTESCPMAQVFLSAYDDYLRFQQTVGIKNLPAKKAQCMEVLERSVDKAITQEVQDMETALPILAITGNSTPFIGLFGTVWGIMKSFHNIGLQGSASLATVAPGISEALIATAVGLAAAIPAVMAYNIFISTTNDIEKDLKTFGAEFLNCVEMDILQRESRPLSRDVEELTEV